MYVIILSANSQLPYSSSVAHSSSRSYHHSSYNFSSNSGSRELFEQIRMNPELRQMIQQLDQEKGGGLIEL